MTRVGPCVTSVLRVPDVAGSLSLSQSTRPHTTELQPPQPVVARVLAATASTVVAPSSHALTICFLVTLLQRHTVVEPGIRTGVASSPRPPAGSSNANGSVGTGVARSCATASEAATSGAPTQV